MPLGIPVWSDVIPIYAISVPQRCDKIGAWERCAESIGATKVPAPAGAVGRVVCPRRASGQAPQYLRDKGAKRIRR